MSKIVIGALTAAAWFALCYVARAEGIRGPLGERGTCIGQYARHPLPEAVLRELGIDEMTR